MINSRNSLIVIIIRLKNDGVRCHFVLLHDDNNDQVEYFATFVKT